MSTYRTRSTASTSPHGSHTDQDAAPSRKLRPVSPEELHLYSWSDGDSDDTCIEPELSDLDEGRPYTFEVGTVHTPSTSIANSIISQAT